MSYYYNYYNNYAQPTYNPGYNTQLSGLNMLNSYEKQSKTKNSYICAIVILVIFLIGALVAVIVLYFALKPDDSAPPDSTNIGLTATRTDITYSSEYADETQNAFQSLALTTCYTITTVASADDYIVTDCIVKSMSASATQGIDISVQIAVFLGTKTEAEVLSGLASTLSTGVEQPLIIDSSSVQLV